MEDYMSSAYYMSSASSIIVVLLIYGVWKVLYSWWIMPNIAYNKLRRNGFNGPPPRFPFGNIIESIQHQITSSSSSPTLTIHHDIHSTVFPHFSRWQKLHGMVFVYWLGTEPFSYVSDPEFVKEMSVKVWLSRRWGKPSLFKMDRKPMFGNGLTMLEGDDWVRHRHAIASSFSTSNLQAQMSLIIESTTRMLDKWSNLVSSGKPVEIEAEEEVSSFTGEVIANASLGISFENKTKIFERIRALQYVLFSSSRFVGVPWGKFMNTKRTMEAKRLGKDIDSLVLLAIQAQKGSTSTSRTIIGSLLAQQDNQGKKKLSVRELVDECKTMMFGGLDTTANTIAWSLLLLAVYPEWQTQIRDEVKEVIGDKEIDATMLSELKKIGWTMSEVLRLYPSAPNTLRQTREDIRVYDRVIPKGTNIWIDTTSMHHDPDIWGPDVNEFRPERFKDDRYGGAKYKIGFIPFGFGGRMRVGKELAKMEYKICLSLILSRFTFKLSPNYIHSPTTLLTLRTSHGLPLIIQPL